MKPLSADVATVQVLAGRIVENVSRVVVGKDAVVERLVIALLSGGHVLIDDVPGVAKTTLAKALARSLRCSFHRLQCTPDLLPSDVTGLSFFNQRLQAFEFRPGPVFTQVLLADEVNRATPRTQAALLEAMEERQVTVDDQTRPLPRPFLVVATQNPVELEGTFPLPEAQLDRFLMCIRLGYPTRDEEIRIIRRFHEVNPLDGLEAVASTEELLAAARTCRRIHVSESVAEYTTDLVRATRGHPSVRLGASPRATLALVRCAQARAAGQGRTYVLPDDVKTLAPAVLSHRLILTSAGQLHSTSSEEIVAQVLETTPVPAESSVVDGG